MSEKDLTDKIKKVPEEDEKIVSDETSVIQKEEIIEKISEEESNDQKSETLVDLEESYEEEATTEVELKEIDEDISSIVETNKSEEVSTEAADIDESEEVSIEAADIDESEEDTGIFSTLLSVIGNVIFSLFLILLMSVVALNIASLVNGNDFSVFNRRFYIVGEDTMYPIIKENDAIIVEEKKTHEINDGDLIVYETIDGEVVTGWVTSLLEKDRFEIKKDINASDSVVIDGIAIIGIASLRIKNMGDFIEFISKPASLVLVLAVGIVIYMVIWFVSKPKKRMNY